jgi:hypothetical protein
MRIAAQYVASLFLPNIREVAPLGNEIRRLGFDYRRIYSCQTRFFLDTFLPPNPTPVVDSNK